jgi:hypothetical protein
MWIKDLLPDACKKKVKELRRQLKSLSTLKKEKEPFWYGVP